MFKVWRNIQEKTGAAKRAEIPAGNYLISMSSLPPGADCLYCIMHYQMKSLFIAYIMFNNFTININLFPEKKDAI